MKILIDKEEILKRVNEYPLEYITTGKHVVSYALFNGDVVKFYYNHLRPDKYIYGYIKYDINRKDHCIVFNDFYVINNREKCDNIYFKDIECVTNKTTKRKKIVGLVIEKCMNFPIEYTNLLEKCILGIYSYSSYINLLEKKEEKEFYNRIKEEYKKGKIEFSSHEIEDDHIVLSDPTLKLNVQFDFNGNDIKSFSFINTEIIYNKIEEWLNNNWYNKLNSSISSNFTINICYKKFYVYFNYNTKPAHNLTIIISLKK